ncbi:hypothetical protein AX16_005792 [Volvariella volvacea WC 439]|nr:hypothetical protein AX16_005792 [Volvariella volvacea WC 439]
MPIVQFAPFTSLVQPSFWHELTRLKIDVLRLSDDALDITAFYGSGRSVVDRETGQEVALGCNLTVGSESFDKGHQLPLGNVAASGTFKNFNTIEDFKATDKTQLFNNEAEKIWQHILTKRDPSLLNRFLLITFADLKKYKYFYWFSFPAFVSKPAWEIDGTGWRNATDEYTPELLTSVYTQLRSQSQTPAFFLIHPTDSGNGVAVSSLDQFEELVVKYPSLTVAFVDPSAAPTNPGWPLRNLLAYLRALYPTHSQRIRILCWRDSEPPSSQSHHWRSRFGVVYLPDGSATESPTARPAAVGWEKNPQGKLGPRVADLAPMMDPTRLANQAVDLNLKLMRWRILPSLDLERTASARCLLLGAGTLGCYVARSLMAWGIRKITFVDSARVSFSNPVRQPLFEFEDCLNGGKPKAECAAERLKKVFPGIDATGHNLSIPMPGHPVPPASVDQVKEDVKKLEELVDEHDVIFLLMDSRESRWLPTVIGATKGKVVINAALGFDSFLVMRHGARATTSKGGKNPQLGCYYCNDIVAPTDSLTDRTLDQMCTVTRPGLAAIASATAVELLASLLQHPDGVFAPAPPPGQKDTGMAVGDSEGDSVLGNVPHQLRGFLAQFRNVPIVGSAFSRCTGCSEKVLRAYETEGFDMLLKAFNDQKFLETLSGLDELYKEGQKALEDVDWDIEEAEGEGKDDF